MLMLAKRVFGLALAERGAVEDTLSTAALAALALPLAGRMTATVIRKRSVRVALSP